MKYLLLALVFSSFTFVGCSKNSACDQLVAKVEACAAKATGENKERVLRRLESVKEGMTKNPDVASGKCEEILKDQEKLALLEELCK